jgi:hypothetical protein
MVWNQCHQNKTVEKAMEVIEYVWFSRYTRPEIKGIVAIKANTRSIFVKKCQVFLESTPSQTPLVFQSPKANKVFMDSLRTLQLKEQEIDDKCPISTLLAATVFAICSAFHAALEAAPAKLVYGRDINLPINMYSSQSCLCDKHQIIMPKINHYEII